MFKLSAFHTHRQIVQISFNKICYFVQQPAPLRSIHGPPRTPQFKSFSSCLDSFVYISLEQKKNKNKKISLEQEKKYYKTFTVTFNSHYVHIRVLSNAWNRKNDLVNVTVPLNISFKHLLSKNLSDHTV